MRMDLGTRNTLLYDFMHCMTAVSLEMSDEPYFGHSKVGISTALGYSYQGYRSDFGGIIGSSYNFGGVEFSVGVDI